MMHHHILPAWLARVAIADLIVIMALILVCWQLNKKVEQERQETVRHWDEV